MSPETLPTLDLRYSRLSQLSFGTVFLILGYGGVGMVFGIIPIEAGQRLQQLAIGFGFLVLAALFGVAVLEMFLAAHQPVVTLDRNGLWDRRLTGAPIPWSAIASIEAVEPSFLERLVVPGSLKGRLVVHIEPGEWDRIAFTGTLQQRLLVRLFSGPGRLRLFYRTLDLPYRALVAALGEASRIERKA